jgi:hypothetical protein
MRPRKFYQRRSLLGIWFHKWNTHIRIIKESAKIKLCMISCGCGSGRTARIRIPLKPWNPFLHDILVPICFGKLFLANGKIRSSEYLANDPSPDPTKKVLVNNLLMANWSYGTGFPPDPCHRWNGIFNECHSTNKKMRCNVQLPAVTPMPGCQKRLRIKLSDVIVTVEYWSEHYTD